MKSTTTIRIETSRYYNVHGKQPSGRGGWFFECNGAQFVSPSYMGYGEAKRAATTFFQEQFPTAAFLTAYVLS